jgi:catechol 2,3-dioxygenase-like lactoylglutathione lyase family enzyme
MAVTRLNHVAVTVGDMDRALAFWADALGLELIGRGSVRKAHLDHIVGLADTVIEWAELAVPGGTVIELFRYAHPRTQEHPPLQPNDQGATHVCLEVADIDEMFRSITERGYISRSDAPIEIPDGDWRGWRDVYVESPDGVIVELSEAPHAR